MTPKAPIFAAVVTLGVVTTPARADEVSGTRSESLYERGHEVLVSLHHGYAELRVRRTVENLGPRHDQAMFFIDVPSSAVATGLRTLGTDRGRPRWFAGELMEAEAAAAKYRELTGIGGYYPKDPALLSWRSQDTLALQVFPVPPGESKTVEYTFLARTEYFGGAHRLKLPGLGTEDLAADVTLGPVNRGDRLEVDGKRVSSGARLRTALGSEVELALVPKTSDPLAGELAVAKAANGRWVTRFSVEAAPELEPLPKRAFVVVVLDASRSLSDELLDDQKTAVGAFLSHLGDAEVELVSFARKPERRYGRFVPAKRLVADLPAMKLEQKNGSNVDLALAEAEKILGATPAGRPRRLVLVSDGNMARRMRPERLRAALGPSGAIAHLATIRRDYDAGLERGDAHPWASAARSTGGLAWNASVGSSDRATLRRVYEEWARPVRVHELRLFSPDIEMGGIAEALPATLDRGEGVTRLFMGIRDVSWVRAEGELWSRKIEHVLHPDASAAKRWAALAFGSEILHELSEPEMMTLAREGGAVSPVTSYLAIEPGVRPSTEGLDHGAGAFGSRSTRAPLVRMGATSVSGRGPLLDRAAWLKAALGAGYKGCGGKPDAATVSLETTGDEVVDVTKVELAAPDALLEACLTEAVWALDLPAGFEEEWDSYTVYL